jgi:hypothetical protein
MPPKRAALRGTWLCGEPIERLERSTVRRALLTATDSDFLTRFCFGLSMVCSPYRWASFGRETDRPARTFGFSRHQRNDEKATPSDSLARDSRPPFALSNEDHKEEEQQQRPAAQYIRFLPSPKPPFQRNAKELVVELCRLDRTDQSHSRRRDASVRQTSNFEICRSNATQRGRVPHVILARNQRNRECREPPKLGTRHPVHPAAAAPQAKASQSSVDPDRFLIFDGGRSIAQRSASRTGKCTAAGHARPLHGARNEPRDRREPRNLSNNRPPGFSSRIGR